MPNESRKVIRVFSSLLLAHCRVVKVYATNFSHKNVLDKKNHAYNAKCYQDFTTLISQLFKSQLGTTKRQRQQYL